MIILSFCYQLIIDDSYVFLLDDSEWLCLGLVIYKRFSFYVYDLFIWVGVWFFVLNLSFFLFLELFLLILFSLIEFFFWMRLFIKVFLGEYFSKGGGDVWKLGFVNLKGKYCQIVSDCMILSIEPSFRKERPFETKFFKSKFFKKLFSFIIKEDLY